MRKRLTGLLAGALLSISTLGAYALLFTENKTTDLSQRIQKESLTFHQGSSQNLDWYYTNNAAKYDLTGANQVYFKFVTTTYSHVATITGSVVNATNGHIRIPFTPANTATNGTFLWSLSVGSNGASIVKHPWGDLWLVRDVTSTNVMPLGTNVDLSSYTFVNAPWVSDTLQTGLAATQVVHTTQIAGLYATQVVQQASIVSNVAGVALGALGIASNVTDAALNELGVASNVVNIAANGVEIGVVSNAFVAADAVVSAAYAAADVAQSTTLSNSFVEVAGDTMSGTLDMGTANITNAAVVSAGDVIVTDDAVIADQLTVQGIVALDTNVWFLPLGTDIDAFIAATANAGDTLVLGSGDYTVTDDIDVTKALTIRGQKGQTRIVTVTDSINVLHITASDVTVQDVDIDVTANASYAANVSGIAGTVLSNVRLLSVNATLNSHAGIQTGILWTDASGEMRNVTSTATSSDTYAVPVQIENAATAEATTTVNAYNCKITAVAGGQSAWAIYHKDSSATQDIFLNLYNCDTTASGGSESLGIRCGAGAEAIAVAYACQFSGGTADVKQDTSATLTLRDCTLVNGTTSGTITYDGATTLNKIAKGNTWYVPIDGDIEAYAAAATAGDTLVLASGTYTVTDDIDVTKALVIKGHKGGTTISTVTDSINVLHITASDVTVQDVTVDVTASGTKAIFVDGTGGTVLTGVRVLNCNATLNSHAGNQYAVVFEDSSGEVRSCKIASTSSNGGIVLALDQRTRTSAEASTALYVYDTDSTASSSGLEYAFACNDSSASQDAFLYLYGCVGASVGSGSSSYGFSAANSDAVSEAYACRFSGNTADVINSGTLTLRDCTLVNGTTSGTITYDGTVVTEDLYASGNVGIGTNAPATALEVVGELTTSGNVGIGTTAPGFVEGGGLEIELGSACNIRMQDTLSSQSIEIVNDGANNLFKFHPYNSLGYQFLDSSANVDFTITSAGNVGIGTNAPGSELHIYDNATCQLRVEADNATGIAILQLKDTQGGGADDDWNIEHGRVDGALTFYHNETKVIFDDDGNVGIGTASPAEQLDVVNNVQAAAFISTNAYCEADFTDGASQDFTAAGGFEPITNFAINVCHNFATATDSNATIGVTGWYRNYMCLSADVGGIADVTCLLYTNGVAAVTPSGNSIGWDVDVLAASAHVNIGYEKLLYIVAGTVVDWRIDVVANETITWDHGTVGIIRK